MSFAEQQDVQRQIAALDEQRAALVQQLGMLRADEYWEGGDYVSALAEADNYGLDMIDYARAKGITRDEAAYLAAQVPADPR